MKNNFLQALAGTALLLMPSSTWAETPNQCRDAGPPSIWIVKSPYPFQAGSERTYEQLYHGPWKARVDIVLYAKPRSQHTVGTVKAGTVVQALLGETIVVHPLRFIAAHDSKVVKDFTNGKMHFATMHKGDVFWVLDTGNEGEFSIWWRCSVVGWDSTEPPYGDQNQLELLGANLEEWVKVEIRKQDCPVGSMIFPVRMIQSSYPLSRQQRAPASRLWPTGQNGGSPTLHVFEGWDQKIPTKPSVPHSSPLLA